MKPKESISSEMGMLAGQIIIMDCLPGLDIDSLQPYAIKNVYKVSDSERERFKKLERAWETAIDRKNTQPTRINIEFITLRKYHHELAKKYLPKEIKYPLGIFNPPNMKTFIDSVEDMLWDCDKSWYKISGKEGEAYEYNGNILTLILKLSINEINYEL